ncbi:MAG: lipopolysaccharide kinase InaA family protein [Phycisphaerales bacterium]
MICYPGGTGLPGGDHNQRNTVDDCPFQLRVERSSPPGVEQLTCVALLREVPGMRYVYDAVWKDRPVIVKLFAHWFHGRRHLRREWRGLRELRERGIDAPQGLFHGRTDQGGRAIVIEKIADALHPRDALTTACDPAVVLDRVVRLCRELAHYHDEGVLQKDLNLNNFLLQGERIIAIDLGQFRFGSRPVGRRRSLSQLAEILSGLPEGQRPPTGSILQEYLDARGWSRQPSDEAFLEARVYREKRGAIERALRKYQRENSKHLRVRTPDCRALFDRAFCDGADPVEFVRRLDELMDQGRVLKAGHTCHVCHVVWNNRQIVVKRYNHQGWIHSLRHTLKMSRARRSWISGHRLRFLDIRTPEPLACVERLKGPLVWCSYIVTEYVPGGSLGELLRDNGTSEEERRERIAQVKNVLKRLGDCRISHGDTKHTNVLMGRDGPILTDLDAMTVHRWRWTSLAAHRKDMSRFAAACAAQTGRSA